MSATDNWLVHDHSDHEELLSHCQESIESEDWESANQAISEFIRRLKTHIELEEQVLYPAYESKIEAPQGPTESLRSEHHKIIRFIRDMLSVFVTRDSEHSLECLLEFEKLLIKHHEKEEDIFLPMASLILADDRGQLLQKMQNFDASKSKRKWEI